jgi:hypothetical protein
MQHFSVVFWILAFARMTAGTGADVRHAGESRHPGVLQKTQPLNLKKYVSPRSTLRSMREQFG